MPNRSKSESRNHPFPHAAFEIGTIPLHLLERKTYGKELFHFRDRERPRQTFTAHGRYFRCVGLDRGLHARRRRRDRRASRALAHPVRYSRIAEPTPSRDGASLRAKVSG